MLVSPYSFCHGWFDTIVYLETKAAKLWTHWSQPFCCRLSERHVEYWTPRSETHPKEHNSKRLLITIGVLFLPKGLPIMVSHSPNILAKYMFLNLPRDVICSTPRFRFVFTPYVLRQRHGIKVIPPTVTCVILIMSRMTSMFLLFHCANPNMISLRMKYASLFPPTGAHGVFKPEKENTVSLILRSMHSWIKTHTDSSSLCRI